MEDEQSDGDIAKLTETLANFARSPRSYPVSENWGVALSEGIRYLMSECSAGWLVESIVLQYGCETMRRAMLEEPRLRRLHCWQVELMDDMGGDAEVTGRANSESPVFCRFFTGPGEFPFNVFELWSEWNGERWVLRLPSEIEGRSYR